MRFSIFLIFWQYNQETYVWLIKLKESSLHPVHEGLSFSYEPLLIPYYKAAAPPSIEITAP